MSSDLNFVGFVWVVLLYTLWATCIIYIPCDVALVWNIFDYGNRLAVHLYQLGNGVVDMVLSEHLDTYSPSLVEYDCRLG